MYTIHACEQMLHATFVCCCTKCIEGRLRKKLVVTLMIHLAELGAKVAWCCGVKGYSMEICYRVLFYDI